MKNPVASLSLSALRELLNGEWEPALICQCTGCSRRSARRFMTNIEEENKIRLFNKAGAVKELNAA